MNTPRTDTEVGLCDHRKYSVVSANFARQLETELAEMRDALEQFTRVAVVELGKSRPDLFERAKAILERTK